MNIEPVIWQASPQELFLKAGEVHIWRIQPSLENYLDPSEQARADRLISSNDRERFILAHNGLRKVLAKYTHQDPTEIIFDKTPSGKPYLKNFQHIHFNLSHTEDMILCAVSANPVGIDVEYLNKNIDYIKLSKRFFNASEIINNKLDFFKLWTAKEAYLKYSGLKISQGLKELIPKEFNIQHFIPAPHYLAAVGGEGDVTQNYLLDLA